MKFDLDSFKQGMKARTENGAIATFIGICEDCGTFSKVIAHVEGCYGVDTFSTNGTYSKHSGYGNNLISMISPWEDVPIDTKVRVKPFEKSEWVNRYFAGVNSQGKPTAWDGGATSWSAEDATPWNIMELVEE